jgi:hypothetical protein
MNTLLCTAYILGRFPKKKKKKKKTERVVLAVARYNQIQEKLDSNLRHDIGYTNWGSS